MAEQGNEITQFLDFLVDAILIVDEQSNIVFANKACAKLFGYPVEVFQTLSLSDLMKTGATTNHKSKVKNFITNQSQARAMMSRNIMPCEKSTGDAFNARISIGNITFNGKSCGIATIQDYSTVQEIIDELKDEANTDPLTKLYNKRHLESVAEKQALTVHDSGCLGVAYLDLNGFKAINDTHGHDVGDILLIEVAERLKRHLRSNDLCFRLGGDEFMVLFSITDPQNSTLEARGVGSKLNAVVSKPVYIEKLGHDVVVGTSIGIGILPQDAKELDKVIQMADEAMYESKVNKLPFVLVSEQSLP